MIICYFVAEIWHVTNVIVIFHFELFFALLKKWKKHLQISSFYICVPKFMIRWCTVPEIWCPTDGQKDGRKKWHIEVGVPPKNNVKIVESKFRNRKSKKSVERKLQFLWKHKNVKTVVLTENKKEDIKIDMMCVTWPWKICLLFCLWMLYNNFITKDIWITYLFLYFFLKK